MDRVIMAVATGFGLGYLPKAPGTWGTLLAFPVYFLLLRFQLSIYFGVLAAVLLVAVFTAGAAEKILDVPDPGIVVIDEIAGMLVTLIGAPANGVVLLLGFILFRLFDIIKPFPIAWVDRHLNGGIGIVMDDVIAGIYALLCLQFICHLMIR